jgi:hypothetical protein
LGSKNCINLSLYRRDLTKTSIITDYEAFFQHAASQLVAALAPGTRVVKALNNMTVPNLEADPVVNGAKRVAFISADDDGAKKRVETLLEGFGYSVIALGNLRDGGLIQQAGGPLAGRDKALFAPLNSKVQRLKDAFVARSQPSASDQEGESEFRT